MIRGLSCFVVTLETADHLLVPIDAVVVDNQSALHQALPERIQARRAQS